MIVVERYGDVQDRMTLRFDRRADVQSKVIQVLVEMASTIGLLYFGECCTCRLEADAKTSQLIQL